MLTKGASRYLGCWIRTYTANVNTIDIVPIIYQNFIHFIQGSLFLQFILYKKILLPERGLNSKSYFINADDMLHRSQFFSSNYLSLLPLPALQSS